MGRIKEAIQIAEEGRKRLPNSTVILSKLSSFYLAENKLKDALETSQSALKINPSDLDALFVSGIASERMQKRDDASSYYKRALEIEPENTYLQLRYTYCLASSGKTKEAEDLYLKLKQEHPNDYRVYQDLGILNDTLGELEKARENFKRAVELKPSPQAYYNYAFLLARIQEFKEAANYFRLYLETTPEGNTPRKEQAKRILSQLESRQQKPQ